MLLKILYNHSLIYQNPKVQHLNTNTLIFLPIMITNDFFFFWSGSDYQ